MESYEIKESARARTVRITVYPDGRVEVVKPVRVSMSLVQEFVTRKEAWIARMRAYAYRKRGGQPLEVLPKPRRGSKAYTDAVASARTLVHERLAHFAHLYGFRYGRVSIRNQRTRWGSCSSKNDLSFNYRIVYLPARLADYIIVHELAHTREHNHSPRFWSQVAAVIPDHKECRRILRTRYQL